MNAETFFLTEYFDYEDREFHVTKENYSLQELYHFAEAYHNYKLNEQHPLTGLDIVPNG